MKRTSLPRAAGVCLLLAAPLLAQQQTAQLVGTITDATGAPIQGAKVEIKDDQRGIDQTATTNGAGEYTIPLLPPSEHYTVLVDKSGFAHVEKSGLVLEVAQTAKADFSLKAGAEASVDVFMDAPALDTQTSSLGQVITGDTVADLPLNGRSTFRLIELTPGVIFNDSAQGQFGDVPVNTTWDANFSINGGRSGSNEFLIDGIPTSTGFFNQITTMPMVDELDQFKVESNNLSAAYGRFSGGVINVLTKTGTNKWHGTLFEFFRNSALDAYDWFTHQQHVLNPTQVVKPPFKMNQFGGTLGGPIVIPHVYNGHDRTFFFVSYQGTRRIKAESTFFSVPYPEEKDGNFARIANTIYNPYQYNATNGNRTAFTNKQITPSLIDPAAQYIAKNFYPDPNVPGAGVTNNYFDESSNHVNQNLYALRVDQNISSWWHMFGRFEYSDTALQYPNHFHNLASGGSSAVGNTGFHNMSFALNNVYTITPSFLVTASYGFARWYQLKRTLSYGFDLGTLGTPGWQDLAGKVSVPVFPNITVTSFSPLGGQVYLNNGNDSHALLVQATKLAGKHNLSFGIDARAHRINYFSISNGAGTYAFTQQMTRQNDTATAQGNAFASFMLGAANSGSLGLAAGNAIQDYYGGVYIQDNYRILPKLTLNFGVRYDGETPFVDRHNWMNQFDPNVPNPYANSTFPNLKGGLVFANTNGLGRAVYSRDHLNIAPRLGFAYNANADMVIRGGFDVTYAPIEIANNAVGFIPNLGYASSTSMNTDVPVGTKAVVPKDLFRNPFPSGLQPITGASLGASTQVGGAINVWHNDMPTPYAEQWNLDTQYMFPKGFLLDIAYAGSQGVHLSQPFNIDTNSFDVKSALGTSYIDAVPNPFYGQITTGTLSNLTVQRGQLALPYPQFTGVTIVNEPWGHSTYHAAQIKFAKRNRGGLTILTAYTWSKWMSNVNGQITNIGSTNSTTVQDFYHLENERSVSEMDVPHNFVMHFIMPLPFGKGKKFLNHAGFVDKLVGGWRTNAIWKEQSGFPIAIAVTGVPGGATHVNLNPANDPIIHGDRSNQDRVKKYFNNLPDTDPGAAFVSPKAYQPGAVRRTFPALRMPGLQNLDFALMKDTRFFDRLRMQFRAEAFNITNTPHFKGPGDTLNGASYGAITDIRNNSERQIQFALKFFF